VRGRDWHRNNRVFTADSLAFIESQEKKHHNKSSKQTMGGIGRARKQVDEFVAPNSVTQEPEGRGGVP